MVSYMQGWKNSVKTGNDFITLCQDTGKLIVFASAPFVIIKIAYTEHIRTAENADPDSRYEKTRATTLAFLQYMDPGLAGLTAFVANGFKTPEPETKEEYLDSETGKQILDHLTDIASKVDSLGQVPSGGKQQQGARGDALQDKMTEKDLQDKDLPITVGALGGHPTGKDEAATGGPAELLNKGAGTGAPAELVNKGAGTEEAAEAVVNKGASSGAPAGVVNKGASSGAPAGVVNKGASSGAPAGVVNKGAGTGVPEVVSVGGPTEVENEVTSADVPVEANKDATDLYEWIRRCMGLW
jgi:hypothetical protein